MQDCGGAVTNLRTGMLWAAGVVAVFAAIDAPMSRATDPSEAPEPIAMHLGLGHEYLAREEFEPARASLEKVLALDPNHAEARRILEALGEARRRVPGKLREARRLIELELFDAAVRIHHQAAGLWPAEARRLQGDYFAAVIGAADDHYLARNFREAAFYYDLATRGSQRFADDHLTRWALSLILSRHEPPFQSVFDEASWLAILRRLGPHLRREGLQDWLDVLSGLALEDRGDATRAAESYARGARQPGVVGNRLTPAAVADLRERAVTTIARAYGRFRVQRRNGLWDTRTGESFRLRVTERFRVHHVNDLVGQRVADACEYHFPRIVAALGLSLQDIAWTHPCDVYVHGTPERFAAASGRDPQVPGVSRSRSSGGRLLDHAIYTQQSADMLLAAVLPHELAHLLLAAATQYNKVPLALDEGFALRFEPPARHIRYERLLRRARDRWPLERLLTATPESLDDQATFYAASRGFVDFLVETRGMNTFLRLCRDRDGIRGSLKRHYRFESIAAASAAWDAYVQPPERPQP